MAGNKHDKSFREYLRDVGGKIRALRDDLGLSTEEAAERAGMSPGFWGLVERAAKAASLKSLFRFAAALDVDVADLVAVGMARSDVVAKGHLRQVERLVADATPAQAKVMVTCCRAILALREKPVVNGSVTKTPR